MLYYDRIAGLRVSQESICSLRIHFKKYRNLSGTGYLEASNSCGLNGRMYLNFIVHVKDYMKYIFRYKFLCVAM